MAAFEYEGGDFERIRIVADEGEEIPPDMAQTYALLQIGGALDVIGRTIYELAEQVQMLGPIEVELKK